MVYKIQLFIQMTSPLFYWNFICAVFHGGYYDFIIGYFPKTISKLFNILINTPRPDEENYDVSENKAIVGSGNGLFRAQPLAETMLASCYLDHKEIKLA